ncbi:putative monocarboxylate permease-like protein [Drepanopeziza brunnea f. sp. 'multigermtubi' MB_m1]|uniref:Putative monocarboxylate permease-like protein n=1 Tax=Marssonina brunnea f. sp. multigermtubi (strain MB_m1) TaxID=1072389 RepID=K1WAJ0_MARBU|nr:putative monocarboxylate permease-like protein [Drepanopeziza brunnea f. sp. 'multigermtubi' MB_m1]EKD14295.1 putative monocarboxylate permease-like protein [Drepanopeziza brunnea f. sp. 'multigermtubi' MB_m1]
MAGGHDPIPQKVDPKGTNARNILEPSTGTEIPEKEERTDESLDESLEEGTTSRKNESLTAGLQVVGAFFMMFNSWGIANTFGAYQNYYENALLRDETPSRISWIGSIQGFLLILVGGLFTGPIFDTGHLRGLVVAGTVLSVFGMMMTSICREYWQFILAQGLVVGVGSGCFLLPSIAVFPQYFTERRALAAGLAAAGGVIHPIVFHELQPRIGFRWATRVIAFIMLATLTIPLAVMRAKVFPSTRRPLFDFQVLRNIPYILFTIGEFFGFMGLYVPFYYITTYSTEKKIAGPNLSFYLLTLINTGSILGRIVPNFFADLTGPLNICTPFVLLCGLIAFCWPSIASLGQAVTFCLAYGFFSGTFVSITGPSIATLSTDLGLVGTHMGMSFAFASLGLLVGNPVAGVLLRGRGWLGPAMFCGATNLLAGLFILGARLAKTGKVLVVQA